MAVVGSMPSVGLYFGIYSFCKKTFQQWDQECYEQRQTLYIALSAAIGNTVASASRVPYEVVKQKLQTKAYASMADAMVCEEENDGIIEAVIFLQLVDDFSDLDVCIVHRIEIGGPVFTDHRVVGIIRGQIDDGGIDRRS